MQDLRNYKPTKILPLLIFPSLQLVAWSAAAFGSFQGIENGFFVGGVVCAALALNFVVHISAHEWVHHGFESRSSLIVGAVGTLLIGLPLDGYRLHHQNHHFWNNEPGDYSSTWKVHKGQCRGRSLLAYSFGWPLFLAKASRDLRQKMQQGRIAYQTALTVRWQKALLVAFHSLLLVTHPLLWFAYFFTVYFGWVLVSVQNYGQHPPIEELSRGTTFSPRWYNWIFLGNGFHAEHHQQPGLPWHQVGTKSRGCPTSAEISVPHLLKAFKGQA